MNKEVIPSFGGWIEFPHNINCLVIELDMVYGEISDLVKYQYGGIMCYQGDVRGKVISSITSDFKWFNPSWWYKLYHVEEGYECREGKVIEKYKKEDVLQEILAEVNKCSGFDFQLDSNTSWEEAQIYVSHKGKLYLITWENCD